MKLRFLNGPYQGRVVDLKADGLTIGRGAENDLTIEDDSMSRRHALITCQGDLFFIEDVGSTNGVRLNGRRITFREPIKRGDHLGLGPYVLQITDTGEMIDTGVAPGPEPAKAPPEAKPKPAADTRPKAPFPWGQAIVLIVLLGAFGWLAYKTFAPAGRPPVTAKPAPPHAEAATPVSPAPKPESTASAKPEETSNSPPASPEPPKPESGEKPATPPAGTAADAPAPLIVITSEPPGATVKLDDTERGSTPVIIRDLPPGRHTVALNLRGYEELVRQIHYPAAIPDKPFVLRQKAGTLLISSTPPGATVQAGPRILGQTPLLLDDLPPGEHEFRLLSVCYDPVTVKAKISDIKPETISATLQPRLGGLEIITFPAGCDILIDGMLVGHTVAASADTRESKPLAINGLIEGEHEIVIQHPLETLDRFKVTVVRGEARRYSRRLWVMDTEVVLTDGTKHYGMMIEMNKFGDVVLAETSKHLERYLKPQIAKVNELTAEQSKALLKKLRTGGLRTDKMGPDPEALLLPEPRGAPAFVAAKAVTEDVKGAAEPEEALLPEEETMTADKLETLMKASTATKLRQYRNKTLTITGVPDGFGRDREAGFVTFGSKIRLECSREGYDVLKDQVATARKDHATVTIKGKVADSSTLRFVLRECELVQGTDQGVAAAQ